MCKVNLLLQQSRESKGKFGKKATSKIKFFDDLLIPKYHFETQWNLMTSRLGKSNSSYLHALRKTLSVNLAAESIIYISYIDTDVIMTPE